MSFADPQTITIAGVTTPLPRVSVGANRSEYQSADGLITLAASSSLARRNRRVLRVDHSKITADPFIPTTNAQVSMSAYIVLDTPKVGYTNQQILDVYLGLKTQAAATSDLLITKLIGGES
jgi:hypothetical protein